MATLTAAQFDKDAGDMLPRSFIHRDYRNGKGQRETTGVRVFDSLEHFARVADQGTDKRFDNGRSDDWAGGSHDDAVRMASGDGWTEALGQVEAITSHVANLVDAETISDSFTYRYDVIGGAIDIGRFLTGEPECMIEAHPVPLAKRGKVARIVVPTCYSGGVDVDLARRRGAAVVGLIDSLARAHYSLEVWSVMAMHGKGTGAPNRIAYSVKVCDAATTYDPALVAFGVGHPTMLRQLSFQCEFQENQAMRSAYGVSFPTGGMGAPSFDACLEDLPEYAQNGPSIVLPELSYSRSHIWENDESIARWVEDQVTAIAAGEAYESDKAN